MGLFGSKTNEETLDAQVQEPDVVEQDAVEPQETQEVDIDALVEARVNEKLSEILPKAKKEKETELTDKISEAEQMLRELQAEKEKLGIKSELDSHVAPEFKSFVEFEAQQKGMSVADYVAQNPQFKAKVAPKPENPDKVEGRVKLDPQQAAFFARLQGMK